MRGFLAVSFLFCCTSLFSQTLLQDNFAYADGDSLVNHGWLAHGSAGINPVRVVSPGLSYAEYPGSGIGNAVRLTGTGEDVNKAFAAQHDQDLYVSCLVKVLDASTGTSEFFLHLNIGLFAGRIYVQKSGSNIAFGAAKASEGAVFTGFEYSLSTVYLVVLRYSHLSGNDNDAVRLFVFASGIPAVEPLTPTIGPLTSAGNEPSEINTIALRQGGSAVPDILVDGLSVASSWEEAGLPVRFSSLRASAGEEEVSITWRTETEERNFGFGIERRVIAPEGNSNAWTGIGFVPGCGTSSSPHDYRFTDRHVPPGRYGYRIKQIDQDGSFNFTDAFEVQVLSSPGSFGLDQNFPNPFNPSTVIRFALDSNERATIHVYDVTGRLVRTLVEQVLWMGRHEVLFEARELPSGTYFVVLRAGIQQAVRRVVITK